MFRHRKLPRQPAVREGLAALEVVITTGLMIPSLGLLLFFGMQVLRNYFSLAGAMLGSPF